MADLTATFEAGVNGATVTTAGGEASETAWDTVTASDLTYDNTHVAHGALAAKFAFNGTARLTWSTAFGTQTNHYGRAYFYFTAIDINMQQVRVTFTDGASDWTAIVAFDSSGRLGVSNSAFGNIAGTTPVAVNQWIRIEWHVLHNTSTGLVEAKLFNSADSTTPTETITFPNTDTGTQATQIHIGLEIGQTNFSGLTFWVDDIVANALSYPGPYVEEVDQVLSMLAHVSGHSVW